MSPPRKERKSRILPLLGPAAALYLIADAASATHGLDPLAWVVAVVAVSLSATPLWLRGLVEVAGTRRTSLLGVSLGIALAAGMGREALSLVRALTLAGALSAAGAIVLDLAFRVPDVITRRGRFMYGLLALICTVLSAAAALPPFELFGELVLAPARLLLAPPAMLLGSMVIALVVRMFRRRFGSTPEALASNAWAVMGLVPALGLCAAIVVLMRGSLASSSWVTGLPALAAPVLLFGHVTAIDARRRPRAGFAVRRYVAGAVTASAVAGGAIALFEYLPPEPITFGIAAAVWWGASVAIGSAARRITHRLLAPYGGRLLDALERIDEGMVAATALDEVAAHVLSALRDASGDLDADPVMWVVDPPREVRLDAARNPRVRNAEFPPSVQTIFDEAPGKVVVAREIHAVVVRRPERRALAELLEAQDAICFVPMAVGTDIEGAIAVPRGRRGSALSLEEIDGLAMIGQKVAATIALIAARDRAQRRIGELAQERDRLEEQLEDSEIALERLQADARALSAGRGGGRRVVEPVAYSPAMRALEERIGDVGSMDAPVTLRAEGGTPIDRVARRIHHRSGRSDRAFVVGDCASTRDGGDVMLFGDDSLPGWMRLAEGGTLLLADIPALSLSAQHTLAEALAVRQARPADGGAPYNVDVRIVATTRAPLEPLVDAGLFDAELARWLTRVELNVPPLRERREDIPSLVLLALDRSCRVLGRAPIGIDQSAMDVLLRHDWSGNLRELQHVIDRAVGRAVGPQVLRKDLPALAPLVAMVQSDPLDGTYAELERRVLVRAMKNADGNKSEAARVLGLKRTTFLDKLRRHGISGKKNAEDAA